MTFLIYSRKSKFTGRGDSIGNQVETCREKIRQYLQTKEAQDYLREKNLTENDVKILVFEDEGFSGKNTARPEFQKMMVAVKANKIHCVVSYRLDRISRSVADFAQTYETFVKHNVGFLCAAESYETATPAGRAMMGMVSVFAQMEREVIAERIKDNMHLLARTGRWLGGHTPTGFQSTKEELVDFDGKTRSACKLVPVKKEMELVKFIYKKFLELHSLSGTVRYLVTNNIRTKNGNDFTTASVKAILRNPVYCIAGQEAGDYFREKGAVICFEENELNNKQGFMPFHRTKSGKDGQVRNEMKEWLIAIGKHNGIIESGTWIKIQNLLEAKREKANSAVKTPYKSEALLSGILVCGECNSAMRPHPHAKRVNAEGIIPYYYVCTLKERSSRVRCTMCNANGAVLDKVIMDELVNFERTDSSIHRSLLELRERLAKKKESQSEQQSFLESELKEKQAEISNLISALGKVGGDVQDDFVNETQETVNKLSAQCKALQNEIEKAALSTTIYTDYESQSQAIAAALKKIKDTMLTATTVEKRELLKSTIERIVWDGEQAHIFLLGE